MPKCIENSLEISQIVLNTVYPNEYSGIDAKLH